MTTIDAPPVASSPDSNDLSPVAAAPRLRVRQMLTQEKGALVAAALLLIVIVAAILAPLLAPFDPLQQEIRNKLAGPSWTHWLGTDDLGRDVLSRLLHGARASLFAAGLAVSVAVGIGVPLGLIAGFAGGWIDAALMRITDTVLSFPALVLAIGVTGALGPGLVTAMCAIGIVFSPSVARLMRGATLSVREEPFVAASQTFGSRTTGVIVRHIVPNAIQPVLVQVSLLLAGALLAEASLSFLGLGVQPPTPSWGSMLGRAYAYLNRAPAQMLAPGVAIAFCALAFNVIGDALRRQLDPRQRR
jgi:peptide/nickel transport system permease protein